MRVLARSLALALALITVPLAAVAAHECVVVNRSDTGEVHGERLVGALFDALTKA